MTSRLPQLAAFRAAAETGSFQEAARVLRLTPSAVSHQVRRLETELGVALFERGVRSVALTPRGRALAAEVSAAMARLEAALDAARAPAEARRLRVSALPLFTNAWLIPRLSGFQAAWPGLSIDIETSNAMAELGPGGMDIAIRTIPKPQPGLACRKLLDLRPVVLCAPALAASLRGPADLAAQVLIHHSARPQTWPDVLRALGVSLGPAPRAITFDTLPAALDAAARGQGVTLGLEPLVWDAIEPGRLVVPFELHGIGANAYFVAHRRGEVSAPARAFAQWLSAEMAADRARLARLAQAARKPPWD